MRTVKDLRILWMMIVLLSSSNLVRSQGFCLTGTDTEEQNVGIEPLLQAAQAAASSSEPCKLYWINVYIHRVKGNGFGYGSSIDNTIINNLNSSFNQYGFYFEKLDSRNWFNDYFSNPNTSALQIKAIFTNADANPHANAIDIYVLPSNSAIQGGFVPDYDKKAMVIGGTLPVTHCSGGSANYEIAISKVVSHEMGHSFGLVHTGKYNGDDGLSDTSIDYVAYVRCTNPNTCQFVSNCSTCNVSSNPTTNMTNFMSNTVPSCMSVFSPMQVDLMRYTLNNSITSVVNDSWVGIAPSITGSLSGPSTVSEWNLIWYSVPDQNQKYGTFDWTVPFGFNKTAGGDGYRNIQVWIQSYAQSGYVQVWKTNICGNGGAKYKYVTVSGGGCGICPITQMSPNPASDRLDISFVDRETGEMLAKQNFEEPREYVITDFMGTVVLSYQSKQTRLKLDLSPIKRNDVYVLNITHGNLGKDRYRLIIER